MPWQTAPGLIIIAGAFTVAGGLVNGVQHLFYGQKREIGKDDFMQQLTNRDREIADRADWMSKNGMLTGLKKS